MYMHTAPSYASTTITATYRVTRSAVSLDKRQKKQGKGKRTNRIHLHAVWEYVGCAREYVCIGLHVLRSRNTRLENIQGGDEGSESEQTKRMREGETTD